MGFDWTKASRKETQVQVKERRGNKVVTSFVSSNIIEVGGLVQFCDRCRTSVEFSRFYHSGKLKYIKCKVCKKTYNI